jgi:heme oxygenase
MTQNPPSDKSGGGGQHSFLGPDKADKAEIRGRSQMELRGRMHRSLRAATRGDQMMIDRLMLRLNLTRREDYGLFLNVHYSALRELAANWRDEDRDDFSDMAQCLQEDLHSLGFSATVRQPTAQVPLNPGARFGVAYVIRGSRSDAMGLRHRVSPLFKASYLDFSPRLTWARFLEQLERHISQIEERDEIPQVISGAKSALASFSSILTLVLT